MLREREPDGDYLTRGAAAYPGAMNRMIAHSLIREALRRRSSSSTDLGCQRGIHEDLCLDLPPAVAQRWLGALRGISWPTSSRKSVVGKGACLGYTFTIKGPRMSLHTGREQFDRFSKMINTDLAALVPGEFVWSSVQVNHNTISSEHRDAGNSGLSVLCALGDHRGGELIVEGHAEAKVVKNVCRFIDGSKLHFNRTHEGERFSLVFFFHKAVADASEQDLVTLSNLGFRVHAKPLSEPSGHRAVTTPHQTFVRTGKFGNVLVRKDLISNSVTKDVKYRIDWKGNLTGAPRFQRSEKDRLSDEAIGGMRNPRVSVDRIPDMARRGRVLSDALDRTLEREPDLRRLLLDLLRGKSTDDAYDHPGVRKTRELLADVTGALNVDPICNDEYKTPIRGHLLHAVGRFLRDPGADAATWTWTGAPAGISEDIPDWNIFPLIEDEKPLNFEDLESDPLSFANYQSMEDEILSLSCHKYLATFDTYEECVSFLGAKPILSRFALLTKEKGGIVKKRTILDAKQSGVSTSAKKMFRVILPRPSDVINDALHLSSKCVDGEAVEFFVLDFSDAFWNIPLKHSERKFFVGKVNNKYVVYLRTAQGSRAAPLTWALVISLVVRCTQALFDSDRLRLQIYVDDPVSTARGTPSARATFFAKITLLWMSLGFPLAFKKAQISSDVIWIGVCLSARRRSITASLKEEILQEVETMSKDALSKNIYPKKSLRTLAGKANHVAGVIYTWRPFLQELWGALYSDDSESAAPFNCVWTRQFSHTLVFLVAFLTRAMGTINRVYALDAYLGIGDKISVKLDASPWGLGGILLLNGHPTSWFSSPLSESDEEIFGHSIGSSTGQQTWECLVVLVALRLWRAEWCHSRAQLEVRGDSIAALTMVMNMKASGRGPGIVARELALELGNAEFKPNLFSHIPGIANVSADALSRRTEPGKPFALPSCLLDVREQPPPIRSHRYFRTLASPAHSSSAERREE